MAKVGPSDSPQFSPFVQMQHGIAALNQPAKQAGPSTAGEGGGERQPVVAVVAPVPPAASVPARPHEPVVRRQAQATASPSTPAAPVASPQLLTMKRFKVSIEESSDIEQAALKLAAKLGVKVDFSKITRALWQVYLKHEEDVLRNATAGMTRERPANDDAVGLAELDEQLAQILSDGLLMAGRRPTSR